MTGRRMINIAALSLGTLIVAALLYVREQSIKGQPPQCSELSLPFVNVESCRH